MTTSPVLAASAMAGRFAALRPLMPGDEQLLYAAALDPSGSHRWRYRGRNVSPEEFHESLHAGVLAQFIAVQRDGSPAAHVLAYDYEPDPGHAYVGIQVLGPVRPEVSMEAMFLFLSFLFTRFDLNKIYMDIPDYNKGLVRNLPFIVLEATHRSHFFFDGEFVDRHIYAIHRSGWNEFFTSMPAEVLSSLRVVDNSRQAL